MPLACPSFAGTAGRGNNAKKSAAGRGERMVKVSLCEFARTGLFGPISLGMSREELRLLLGNPPMWDADSTIEDASIWRYSDIEFYFQEHKLWMIFTDHESLADGGETLEIGAWVVRPGLPRNDLEPALREHEITYRASHPAYDPRQCHVLTSVGVKFSFLEARDYDDEELGLFSWCQLCESPQPQSPESSLPPR